MDDQGLVWPKEGKTSFAKTEKCLEHISSKILEQIATVMSCLCLEKEVAITLN